MPTSSNPQAIALNAAGTLIYYIDSHNNIFKIDQNSGVSKLAGNGNIGYAGDGGAASAAVFYYPLGLALDANNNLYIADTANCVIRKINAGATPPQISLVAGTPPSNGTPQCNYTGDGPALSTQLVGPHALAFDNKGELIIVDYDAIRSIDPNGNITTSFPNTLFSAAVQVYGNSFTPPIQLFGLALTANGGYSVDRSDRLLFEMGSNPGAGAVYQSAPGAPSPNSSTFTAYLTASQSVSVSSIAVPPGFTDYALGTPPAANLETLLCSTDNGQTWPTTVTLSTTNPPNLAAGTICQIPITFTPSKPGIRTAPLVTIVNTGSGPYAQSAGMTGYSMGPSIGLLDAGFGQFANFASNANIGNFGGSNQSSLSGGMFDAGGNFIVTTGGNHTVWAYNSQTNSYWLVAGTPNHSGNDQTHLNNPSGVDEDAAGNLIYSRYQQLPHPEGRAWHRGRGRHQPYEHRFWGRRLRFDEHIHQRAKSAHGGLAGQRLLC